MSISNILAYLNHNWLQLTIDIGFAFNIVVAGLRAMGWTKLADECTKIENAIQAMVVASLNKNQNKGDGK